METIKQIKDLLNEIKMNASFVLHSKFTDFNNRHIEVVIEDAKRLAILYEELHKTDDFFNNNPLAAKKYVIKQIKKCNYKMRNKYLIHQLIEWNVQIKCESLFEEIKQNKIDYKDVAEICLILYLYNGYYMSMSNIKYSTYIESKSNIYAIWCVNILDVFSKLNSDDYKKMDYIRSLVFGNHKLDKGGE